jgi:hypothetical protein
LGPQVAVSAPLNLIWGPHSMWLKTTFVSHPRPGKRQNRASSCQNGSAAYDHSILSSAISDVWFFNATWALTLPAGSTAFAPALSIVVCEPVGAKDVTCWAQPTIVKAKTKQITRNTKYLLGGKACCRESIICDTACQKNGRASDNVRRCRQPSRRDKRAGAHGARGIER